MTGRKTFIHAKDCPARRPGALKLVHRFKAARTEHWQVVGCTCGAEQRQYVADVERVGRIGARILLALAGLAVAAYLIMAG